MKRMKWAKHIARMGIREKHRGFCWKNLKEVDSSENLGLDGRMILKLILRK
jgi:hypothetical protein